MGRVGVDLYPLQVGVRLEDVETFGKFLGGSATNVAVAAARHGRRSAVDHPHRRRPVRRASCTPALRGSGSTTAFVTPVDGPADAGDVLRDLPPGRLPALLLPRAHRARPGDRGRTSSTWTRSARPGVFWATVTGLSQEPSRSAHHAAWEARAAAPLTVLDLDYRPMFWPSRPRRVRGRSARRWSTSPSPSATARSARSPSARATPSGRPTRCSTAASSSRSSSRGPRACSPSYARRARRGAADTGRRSSTASAPATASAARCATACSRAGRSSGVLRFANAAGAIVASRARVLAPRCRRRAEVEDAARHGGGAV